MITASIKVEELPNGFIIFEFIPGPEKIMTDREAEVAVLVAHAMDKIMEVISSRDTVVQSTVVSGAGDALCDALIEQARNAQPPQ